MRARWAGVDENIGAKMCWKLVDEVSAELICRSTIRSVIEPGTANLQVNPLEPLELTKTNGLLDNFISLADFDTSLMKFGAVDSIPASTKSKTWQDIKRGE